MSKYIQLNVSLGDFKGSITEGPKWRDLQHIDQLDLLNDWIHDLEELYGDTLENWREHASAVRRAERNG